MSEDIFARLKQDHEDHRALLDQLAEKADVEITPEKMEDAKQ